MDKKKIKLILLLLSMLFFNCKETDNNMVEQYNYINFKLNYCDLIKPMQKNIKLKSLIIIENKKYFIYTYFDENKLIIDNIIDINLNNNLSILINGSYSTSEILNFNNYKSKLNAIFNNHLKTKNNLTVLINYNDNIKYEDKIELIKPILNYIKNKNDSLSIGIYNKKYNDLKIKEKLKIEQHFSPILYFPSCKSPIPSSTKTN